MKLKMGKLYYYKSNWIASTRQWGTKESETVRSDKEAEALVRQWAARFTDLRTKQIGELRARQNGIEESLF